jgi:LuxR family maltose regulon positive regulatory protein
LGNLPEAAEALDRAEQLLGVQGVFPEAESVVEAARVRLWLAQDDLVQVARWAQNQRGPAGTPDLWQELEYLALARVLLAQGQEEDASSLLAQLAEAAEAEGRNGRLIEILTLQAMALQAQNRMADAVTVLDRALSLAQPEGYVRVFVDEGAPMAELLRQAATRGIAPGYVQALLEAGETDEATIQSSIVQPLVEPLSEREIEVLGLIVSGLSNAEIARELVITVGTTKWHITNIYGKLQVRSRAQAIKRAHQLNLV